MAEVALHNSWFLEHVISDADTILIAPRYKLNYRDEYLGYLLYFCLHCQGCSKLTETSSAPELRGFDGFDSNFHASLSGVPNLLVPCMVYSDGGARYMNLKPDEPYQSASVNISQTSPEKQSTSQSPYPLLDPKVCSSRFQNNTMRGIHSNLVPGIRTGRWLARSCS